MIAAIYARKSTDLRDVTGVEASRVTDKLSHAYEKFKLCPAGGAVHLVVLAVDNTVALSDVAEALYGREELYLTRGGRTGRGRHPAERSPVRCIPGSAASSSPGTRSVSGCSAATRSPCS